MYFEIVGSLSGIEVIAEVPESGTADDSRGAMAAGDGVNSRALEVHWYEAHGVGRVRYKIKRFLD